MANSKSELLNLFGDRQLGGWVIDESFIER